jgi:hypothetical protein
MTRNRSCEIRCFVHFYMYLLGCKRASRKRLASAFLIFLQSLWAYCKTRDAVPATIELQIVSNFSSVNASSWKTCINMFFSRASVHNLLNTSLRCSLCSSMELLITKLQIYHGDIHVWIFWWKLRKSLSLAARMSLEPPRIFSPLHCNKFLEVNLKLIGGIIAQKQWGHWCSKDTYHLPVDLSVSSFSYNTKSSLSLMDSSEYSQLVYSGQELHLCLLLRREIVQNSESEVC